MTKRIIPSTAYGFARASHNANSGFGHIHIYVYELMGYGRGTLKITCQTGGFSNDEPTKTYGQRHGLSADFDVVELAVAQKGYYLLRTVAGRLERKAKEYGPPASFADYAARVLEALEVPVVRVLQGVNAELSCTQKIEELPGFNPREESRELRAALSRLEDSLLDVYRRRR